MQSPETGRMSRREAVLASLAFVDAAAAETRFRRFLEAGGGSVNEWDQRFLDFIANHRDEPLLSGAAGAGFGFVVSVRSAAGFWVLEARDGARGKGFFNRLDAERILGLAREKGLEHCRRAPRRGHGLIWDA